MWGGGGGGGHNKRKRDAFHELCCIIYIRTSAAVLGRGRDVSSCGTKLERILACEEDSADAYLTCYLC